MQEAIKALMDRLDVLRANEQTIHTELGKAYHDATFSCPESVRDVIEKLRNNDFAIKDVNTSLRVLRELSVG